MYFISHLTLTNSFTAAVVGLMRYAPAVMLAGQARIFAQRGKTTLAACTLSSLRWRSLRPVPGLGTADALCAALASFFAYRTNPK